MLRIIVFWSKSFIILPRCTLGARVFWQIGESFFMRFTFQSTVYHNLRKFLLCTCDSIYSHVIHFFVWEKENFNSSIQHVNIKLNIICLQVHLDVNFFPFLLLLFINCVGLLTLLSNYWYILRIYKCSSYKKLNMHVTETCYSIILCISLTFGIKALCCCCCCLEAYTQEFYYVQESLRRQHFRSAREDQWSSWCLC